ncbi:MAG: U32 family peptidase, partial [Oscillospiraceae bacterium]|nr:U32 family peptidase [Oscillospiraceae bacterium]
MRKPELLCPAGDMERLIMAVLYGADAVYLAGTSFGMRSFAGNFADDELPAAVRYAHEHGVKVHVTVNTMPRGDELNSLPAHLERLESCGVDALILADLGVFRMAERYAPHCKRHVSTQQSVANAACAQAWFELGASRIVLARELHLDEIAAIRASVSPELELETFCHGAMCVSYSGRCLLSNYMTGRDANRGACAQPCRYRYALMEEKRPGEYFPVFEDEKGTYIMNSRDMCMIDHLDDLMRVGVDCLKIEGRAKSAYYAAVVTGAYRHVLDAVAAGEAPDPVWRDEVEHVSHRHYSTGFFY